MKKTIFILFFLSITFCLNAQHITESDWKNYSEQLEKTVIGMTLKEFNTVWSEAVFIGHELNDNEITLWRFSRPVRPFTKIKYLYFYFKDGQLTKFHDI